MPPSGRAEIGSFPVPTKSAKEPSLDPGLPAARGKTQAPDVGGHFHAADLHGLSRLSFDAVMALTDLVEAMHANIAKAPAPWSAVSEDRSRGITAWVYRSIRGVTGLVGSAFDAVLKRLVPLFGEHSSSPEREAVLAALNGVLGDHLEARENPLAIRMRFRVGGQALPLERAALARAMPNASARLLVLLHGLCRNDLQWRRQGHDHGAELARELGLTAVYLHYNSGRHVSTNGRDCAALLEQLVAAWPVPVESIALLGHSMGGLVARSACFYGAAAGHAWRGRLRQLVFLGTPHHGAPLERGGHWIDTLLGASPYTAPLARLGKMRSAGITDLRHGWLVDEDWQDRGAGVPGPHRHRALPLPEGPAGYAIAATTGKEVGDLKDRLIGDGLVPLASALGCHAERDRHLMFAEDHQMIVCGTGHLELLAHRGVYQQLRRWLAEPIPSVRASQ